ncbi:hypothetical protein BJ912DRAFT_1093720 [Pholiota molesta]|nr:hypothetical protein BJ912DRAFT_1093720 [Pholiota molesta]
MPFWLITGSNRGIGYGLVENLLKKENTFVIAAARNANAPSLTDLASKHPDTLKVVELDITSQESVDKAVAIVTPLLLNGLDYLINNAGANPQPTVKFDDLDLDLFAEEIGFNTTAPLRVSRAYSVAKAALNMLAHKWAATLKYEGVITAAVHPGWTQTPLGEGINEWMEKYAAHVRHFTPGESADNVVKVSEALTLEKTGR